VLQLRGQQQLELHPRCLCAEALVETESLAEMEFSSADRSSSASSVTPAMRQTMDLLANLRT